MSLWGVLAGTAVVAVGALAAAYIFDRLSDREVRRQERMRDDYDDYCSERRSEYYSTVSGYENAYNSRRADYQRQYEEERRRQLKELQNRNRQYLDNIRENLNEQRKEKNNDLKQLQDFLKQWEEIKDKAQATMLRMKSMKTHILHIEEACYKLQAYICYLDRYEHNMDYQFNKYGTIPEPFSMTLPDYYPYPGKIFTFSKNNFHKDGNGGYIYNVPEEKNLSLYVPKHEAENFEKSNYEKMSFMVNYNRKAPDKLSTNLSISKAEIKLSMEGNQGIYAEVIDISNNWIKLSYKGQFMSLNRSDLINPAKHFPKGVYLTVFLIDYNFALNNHLKVSEKVQDSMSLESFGKIDMICPIIQYRELYKTLEENEWLDFEDEWLIGPADINEPDSKLMKLQMGNYYGYLAEFKYLDGKKEHMVLEYKRMLEKDEFFTYTDVCVATDVSINCYNNLSECSECSVEECAYLYTYLVGEFNSQKRILNKSPMAHYFDKWLELTNRLIDVKQYKKRIKVEINSWEKYKNSLYMYISKENKLNHFIKSGSKGNNSPQWYIYDKINDKYLRCYIDASEETNEILLIAKGMEEETIIESECIIDLVLYCSVYAEKSQSTAFSEFREGRVSCFDIKEIILQPSCLQYHDSGNRIDFLYNKSIESNEYQFKSVHRAFAVDDFFMIQGPPGTGKTTVIKELIMQQLHFRPESKILIVSQANVAVDNVIRGIIKLCSMEDCISENQIIRCGTEDKIADDIIAYSYQGRMQKYFENLKISDTKNSELRQQWIEFADNPDNKNIVGEYLLKGYQIIGATCVGITNRNIGLTGLDFDLVIIDEAGKALPGELIIPMNRAKKLIVIGDHKQLPPVVDPEFYENGDVKTDDVLEEEERIDFFNKSFFERLWTDCPDTNKCMLNTQFRMPSVISGLVNLFYDGNLKDGHSCYSKIPVAFDSNLVMLDMKDEEEYCEKKEELSGLYNEKEKKVVVELVKKLREVYSADKRIVVITPYKRQKSEIIRFLKENRINNVWVNTIDAFQGDEEDIVIYCMTRSKRKTNYFSDSARLNVAFSRAKNLLLIIGSSKYLRDYGRNHVLNSVYEYIKDKGRIIPYSEFESDDFTVSNIKNYHSINNTINETTEYGFGSLDDIFMIPKMENASIRKCEACEKILDDKNENVICFDCLNMSDNYVCAKCGKNKISFPRYYKYVKKDTPPELCDDCRNIFVSCSQCGKKFEMPATRYNFLSKKDENITCSDCLYKVTVTCSNQKCNTQFKVDKKYANKRNYCPQCKEEMLVACDRCGRSFYIYKWLHNDLRARKKGCICEECRNY